MGFPLGYSELILSKLIFHAFAFLCLVRNLIYCFLGHLGLAHLLESDVSSPDHPPHIPQFESVSAILIRQILPVSRFHELCVEDDVPDRCAVCLYEFEGQEEIRRLANCRHIFHRTCLDPWLDQDQKTCPLCRALFIPEELLEDFYERFWEAAGVPDYYNGDYS